MLLLFDGCLIPSSHSTVIDRKNCFAQNIVFYLDRMYRAIFSPCRFSALSQSSIFIHIIFLAYDTQIRTGAYFLTIVYSNYIKQLSKWTINLVENVLFEYSQFHVLCSVF